MRHGRPPEDQVKAFFALRTTPGLLRCADEGSISAGSATRAYPRPDGGPFGAAVPFSPQTTAPGRTVRTASFSEEPACGEQGRNPLKSVDGVLKNAAELRFSNGDQLHLRRSFLTRARLLRAVRQEQRRPKARRCPCPERELPASHEGINERARRRQQNLNSWTWRPATTTSAVGDRPS